jgi:hypothetical protein
MNQYFSVVLLDVSQKRSWVYFAAFKGVEQCAEDGPRRFSGPGASSKGTLKTIQKKAL